jgi:hypothetical protein
VGRPPRARHALGSVQASRPSSRKRDRPLTPQRASLPASAALATSLVLLGACAAAADPVLNEVLYDPPGADGGSEFVELLNTGVSALDLAGLRLEFANGAAAPAWERRWEGAAGDSLQPGARWLIADSGWTGSETPNALVSLRLQNGPDAVRLRRGETVLDLLGYGDLTDAALFEAAPHPGAAGASLARRPDGADSDRNDQDWVVCAEPTPGRPNFPAHALQLLGVAAEPPSLPAPGCAVTLAVTLRNTGLAAFPAGIAVLSDGGGTTLAEAAWTALAPQAEATVTCTWSPLFAGDVNLGLEMAAPAVDTPILALGRYHVGPSPLSVWEVMADPADGGGEWIEVAAGPEAVVELGDYLLSDAGGTLRRLPSRQMVPGERLVLAQDAAAFRDWWEGLLAAGAPPPCPGLPAVPQLAELPGGWPALNNSPGEGRPYAERVHLHAADGSVLDHATLGARGTVVTGGRSLERRAESAPGDPADLWGACMAAAGATPGCRNSLESPLHAPLNVLAASPGTFAAGSDGVSFTLNLAAPAAAWRLTVWDLWGRRVRDLGGDELGAGRRHVAWDGRDDTGRFVPPGPYVAVLDRLEADGGRRDGTRLLIVAAPLAGR